MAIQDLKTLISAKLASVMTVTADGALAGDANDTSFLVSVYYTFNCTDYTDGNHVIGLEESDDNITYTVVPRNKIVGTLATIAAANVSQDALPTIGIFSNKRYIKPVITSDTVTVGAVIEVVQTAKLSSIAS